MPFFSPKGGPRLHVDESGGSGAPMLFQHGLCGAASQPAEVFPTGSAFRRITVECRGHGASEAGDTSAFSIARFTDDIAETIGHFDFAPVVMGGISMGAAIALRLAVKRPHLVRALVIARPAWLLDSNPPNAKPNIEVGELLKRHPPEQALLHFNSSATARMLESEGPDNLLSLRGFFKREPIAVTSALLTSIASDGPGVSLAEVKAIAIPTLVIGHGHDHVHPLAMARDLAGLIAKAQFREITPKAIDKARYVTEFKSALHDFLREIS